jgi:hypothetical protein
LKRGEDSVVEEREKELIKKEVDTVFRETEEGVTRVHELMREVLSPLSRSRVLKKRNRSCQKGEEKEEETNKLSKKRKDRSEINDERVTKKTPGGQRKIR